MKLFFLTIFYLIFSTNIFPCTIFSISDDQNNFVGNNEDYLYGDEHFLKIIPPKSNNYGRLELYNKVKISFLFNVLKISINNVQGGMNDKGLFFDMAGTPQDNVTIKRNTFQKNTVSNNTLDMFLAKCKTIDEAIMFWKSIRWGSVIPSFHMLIADKTGKSIIIEWTDGDMKVIEKKGVLQIITNYLVTKPWLPNGGGWEREDTFFKYFDPLKISMPNAILLLKLTAQKSDTIGTLYSNVYDLKKLTMTLFILSNDSNIRTFDLIEEFNKGEKIYPINYQLLSTKWTS
jgi:hypothetical protein